MKLFLTSDDEHPNVIPQLENFIGKPLKHLKIAYIPTAANGLGYSSWKIDTAIKVVYSTDAEVKIVELEDQCYKDVITPIKNSDVIWIPGGMAAYLMYWVRMTELDKALPEILEKTIYVGSSSGSMICSQTLQAAEFHIEESEPSASLIPGLGYLDFEIYPHYQENVHSQIDQHWQHGKLQLLKDGETITFTDGQIKTIGEERYIIK